jgi:hypothetical protein
MVQDDARRFFLAARMRAFGAKTVKELVLMQREYSLKGLAEKIESPTLVCDNVGDAVAGGQGKKLYESQPLDTRWCNEWHQDATF